MKKLFSLLLVALISSQMWAADVYTKVYIVGIDGTTYTKSTTNGTYGTISSSDAKSIAWDTSSSYKCYKVTSTGNTVKFTLVPSNVGDYEFIGWYNGQYSTSTCKSTSTSYQTDRSTWSGTIYAHFRKKVTNVTVAVAYATGSNNTMGTIGGGTTVAAGTNVTLTASANSNYTFKGWSTTQNGNSILSNSNVASYQVSASNATYYAVFEAGPVAPSAGSKASYTVTPGEHVRQQVANVDIPNFSNSVDLGLDILWANKNVGASGIGNRGTNYYRADAIALTPTTLGGAGWRLPTQDEASSSGLGKCTYTSDYTANVTGTMTFTRGGYNGVSLEVPTDGAILAELWTSTQSGDYYKFIQCNVQTNTYGFGVNQTTSSTYQCRVRPVFDLAAAGIKKLTIQMVKDGVTSTNIYYCANNQQVDITPKSIDGYNSSWTSGPSGTGTKTFTVTSNTTATITYTEIPQNYELDWDANGGSFSGDYTEAGSVSGGASITAPTATRTGYTFNGWDPDFTGKMPSDNVTYTAQWTATNYSIIYNQNGGSGATNGTYTIESTAITLPTAPTMTKTGYTFAGWYADSDLSTGGVVTSILAGSTGNKEFWAKWTAVTYNLTYNGLEEASNSNPTTYTIETATFDLANPGTRTGYTFTGWTCGGNAITQIAVGSTGDKTITANWTENNYSVTFRTSEEDANPAVKSDYHYGDEITNCPAIDPQKIGDETHTYTFLGWYLDNTETRYEAGMTVSGNMMFTARFNEQIIQVVPVTYNVTIGSFAANGKVIITSQDNVREITATGATLTFDAGKSLTIQAVPNTYYHFAGWTEDNDEEAVIDIRTLNKDLTYTPTFAANEPLMLEDNHDKDYYTSLYSGHYGDVLTVTLKNRKLTEGSWITFCAPFDFTIPAGHPFYGTAYQLQNATMSGSNTSAYISLDFRRTYEIRANVPYLIVPTMTTVSNLEFDGVTIEEAPTVRTTAAQSGHVEFVSVPWQTIITNDSQKSDIYLASGNTLRYVSTAGTTFRAFRAYFHRVINLGAPRRMVISLDGVETTKQLTEDGEVTDTTEKRLENGVLIIERNGVRYDAQGKRL